MILGGGAPWFAQNLERNTQIWQYLKNLFLAKIRRKDYVFNIDKRMVPRYGQTLEWGARI